MGPDLSHRLAPIRRFEPFRSMEVDEWLTFVHRVDKADVFADMAKADRNLVLQAEANMPAELRNRWKTMRGK